MTDPLGPQDDGATPLDDNEREGLVPSYVTLRSELNEAEQANILEAEGWVISRKRSVLHERFLDSLHQRIFGNIWRWGETSPVVGASSGVARRCLRSGSMR